MTFDWVDLEIVEIAEWSSDTFTFSLRQQESFHVHTVGNVELFSLQDIQIFKHRISSASDTMYLGDFHLNVYLVFFNCLFYEQRVYHHS